MTPYFLLVSAQEGIKGAMASRSVSIAAATLVVGLGLAGCGLVTRPVPDEFTVVTKAPLVVPPDYGLRPPAPGAPAVQALAPATQAQAALRPAAPAGLFGAAAAPAAPANGRTAGEQALLARARAVNPDPNIRAVIDLEAARIADRNRAFIRQILSWQKEQDPLVNPAAEAERLRTAANAPAKVVAPPTAKREGGFGF